MRSHCLIFWLACSLPLGAAAHPFHGCTGEAEWNPRTEHLEVALRVDAPGLERALRRHRQAAVDLDRTEMLETLLADYVRDTFQIEQADGRIAQLIWVGQEINLQDAWLYFEIPVEQRQLAEIRIRHRMLFELFPDQVNTLQLVLPGRRTSLVFSHQGPRRSVAASPADHPFTPGWRRPPPTSAGASVAPAVKVTESGRPTD